MAKIARDDDKGKTFSPIDSKLLGTLAGAAPVEPAPTIQPTQAEPPEQPQPHPAERKPSPQPKRHHSEASTAARPIPAKLSQPPSVEKLERVVKCLFTPSEEQELRNLVNRLRLKAGFSLSVSHLMRPFFELLLHSEDQLGEELVKAGLRRPINDKNALAAFERHMAHVIHEALRKTETTNDRA